jgi:hypothetical protein
MRIVLRYMVAFSNPLGAAKASSGALVCKFQRKAARYSDLIAATVPI